MKDLAGWLRGSATGKGLFVGLLVLLLLIPLGMIEGLIAERGGRLDEAKRQLANAWGGAQLTGGPVLVLPVEYARTVDGKTWRVTDEIYQLPSSLDIDVAATTQTLARGIYEIPVYTATVELSGSLAPPVLDEAADLGVHWAEALLTIPIRDARSIRDPVRIEMAGGSAVFAPGGVRIEGLGSQLTVPLAALGVESLDGAADFAITLRIGGTGSLEFLPFGNATNVRVQSDWPSPSFVGAFLPDERSVGRDGFDASWRVLDLGRGYASSWSRSSGIGPALSRQIPATAFGVDLVVPIGVHEASLRAIRYAVLFLALTFLAFFLFELRLPLRVHPLQYLLVGCANALFYLLLVALSEHVGFHIAYVSSAAGAIALIGGYSASVLRAPTRAMLVALMLLAVYGYLYVTLQLEDFALLSGSLGLAAMLAAVMYLTRRVDWDAVSLVSDRNDGAQQR